MDANSTDDGARPRSRRLRWVVLTVVLLLLAWTGAVAWQTNAALGDARSGLDAMEELRDTSAGSLDALIESVDDGEGATSQEEVAAGLRAAAADFEGAAEKLDSPVMAPTGLVPVLRRQVESAEALANAAQTVALEAAAAVEGLDDVLAMASGESSARVEVVRRSGEVLDGFEAGVADIDLGPDEALLGPLADARNRFAREYNQVIETLAQTSTVLAGVDSFLTGPTRYLVLGSSNAEMRAGGGMVLQVGELEIADGAFTAGEFLPTDGLDVPAGLVRPDGDVEALWSAWAPTQEWRNTNMTPRFDTTGAASAAMWEARGGAPVDGVMAIDVPAIEGFLELTGPVTLPDGEVIEPGSVRNDLLLEQYREFEDRDARRERLGQLAGAALDALNSGDVAASDLLGVLRDLGERRHLMMWSSDPVQQAAWEELGTAGIPAQDSMLLSVMNRGANKLDPFMEVSSDMSVEETDTGHRVSVEVAVTNNTPSGLPSYVAGSPEGSGLQEGEYRGVVALTLPGGAGNITTQGGVPVALGDDGPTRVAANEIQVPRGATVGVTFTFDLLEGWESLTVLPSARVPPTTWTAGGQEWTDRTSRSVDLTRAS